MKYLTLLTIIFTANIATAKLKPKDYFAFDNNKQLVFELKFNRLTDTGSGINFNKTCDTYTARIDSDSGIYYLYNKCSSSVAKRYHTKVDTRRNYEIVLTAKMRYYEERYWLKYGFIMWNITDSQQYNIFSFSGDRQYFYHTHAETLAKTDVCIGKLLIKHKHYNYNSFVRYTIRKYADKYYIFRNGILMYTGSTLYENQQAEGSDIAIGALGEAHVEFKDISIYYLP